MNRRDLIALAGGAIALPRLAASGQQPERMLRMGYLGTAPPRPDSPLQAGLHRGLAETGFVDGKNVAIEYCFSQGHYERLAELAADLVRDNVSVIMTVGGNGAARAAKEASASIPIVFLTGGDPVQDRLTASLARPGGNLTGVTMRSRELEEKGLELFSELLPRARSIAVLVNPTGPGRSVSSLQEAARAKGIGLDVLNAGTAPELDTLLASFARRHLDGLIVAADPYFYSRRVQIVALAARYRIPAIYPLPDYAKTGGLIEFGPNLYAVGRQIGTYAGRILGGAKPADLPVQEVDPELIINLKTADALGLAVPQTLLARADEVIE